jgi:glycosyltransferase involved in cell wall biosynthesis
VSVRSESRRYRESLIMSAAPSVTVLMPVRNGAAFIREAIDSVLAQDFADYELLIVNDGSTDATVEIVESYTDPRIRLLSYPQALGQTYVRIEGMRAARGKYVALLDADDISLPSRLSKQIAFLEANPQFAVCGTLARTIGDHPNQVLAPPTNRQEIICRLLFGNVFVHSTVMMRKQLLDDAGLNYLIEFECAQDYDLFVRCAQQYPLVNLPEVLTLYRRHPNQVSVKDRGVQEASCYRILHKQLQYFGLEPSAEEFQTHLLVFDYAAPLTPERIDAVEKWLKKLLRHNRERKMYPEPTFSEIVGEKWLYACWRGREFGYKLWRRCVGSPLFQRGRIDLKTFRRTDGYQWAFDLVSQSYEPRATHVRARRLVEAAAISPLIVADRFFLGACKQLVLSVCRAAINQTESPSLASPTQNSEPSPYDPECGRLFI